MIKLAIIYLFCHYALSSPLSDEFDTQETLSLTFIGAQHPESFYAPFNKITAHIIFKPVVPPRTVDTENFVGAGAQVDILLDSWLMGQFTAEGDATKTATEKLIAKEIIRTGLSLKNQLLKVKGIWENSPSITSESALGSDLGDCRLDFEPFKYANPLSLLAFNVRAVADIAAKITAEQKDSTINNADWKFKVKGSDERKTFLKAALNSYSFARSQLDFIEEKGELYY